MPINRIPPRKLYDFHADGRRESDDGRQTDGSMYLSYSKIAAGQKAETLPLLLLLLMILMTTSDIKCAHRSCLDNDILKVGAFYVVVLLSPTPL
jgi:hypothetical protein